MEMWGLCLALFGAAKCWVLTVGQPLTRGARGAFLGLWVGMDAEAFVGGRRPAARPSSNDWMAATGKTLFGVGMASGIARIFAPSHPLVAGWIGMAGLILCLHFGTFHLLALAWRRAGVPVTLLMDRPLRAGTLAEFWGQRWNRAFIRLTRELIFLPASRRWDPRAARWLAFLASGLVHELVISVPARGGWGGPTLYFLLQAAGIAAQRSPAIRRHGWAAGMRGRVWTLLWVGTPAFILFHAAFVERVILPFMHALKAL